MKRMLRRKTKNTSPRTLRCENLEDRRVLATMVGNEADLRAVLEAVPVSDNEVILTADITLTTGQVAITSDSAAGGILINGNGFTITGTGTDRVFGIDDGDMIADSFKVTFQDITITGGGGVSFGGGVASAEELEFVDSVVTGNQAIDPTGTYTGVGGGIDAQGSLTLTRTQVTGNTAAAIADIPNPMGGFFITGVGGGVNVDGVLNMSYSNVDGNMASNIGGGLVMNGVGPHVIDNSSFDGNMIGNQAVQFTPGLNAIGGGFYADAGVPGMDLTITNTSMSGNMGGGTAAAGDNTFDYGIGGSISTRGINDVITLDNLTISNNVQTSDGITAGALSIQRGTGLELTAVDGGTFNLTNSTISGNQMSALGDFPGYGGGLSVATFDSAAGFAYPGIFNVVDTDITGNTGLRGGAIGVRYNGGYNNDGIGARSTLTVTGGSISGNTASYAGDGGGAQWAWLATDITFDGVDISNNVDYGGGGAFANLKAFNSSGLYANADLTINNSTISGNTSFSVGGAILATTSLLTYTNAFPNQVTINNSTVSGNVAYANGGAFYAYDSNLTIYQSTVSGNVSTGVGGGANLVVACVAGTGPCYTGGPKEAQFVIDRSTFAYNSSAGATIDVAAETGLTMDNTLLTDNITGGADVAWGGSVGPAPAAGPTTLTVNYSLAEADNLGLVAGAGVGNITGVNGDISPLANNGGPTLTHALNATSPARNAATPGQGAGQADQRGATPRDNEGTMDIGSYEYGATISTTPDCDFDGDGACDIDDIDMLTMETAAGTNNLAFDLNGDLLVNTGDITQWLIDAGARPENAAFTNGNPFFRGDFNLDGFVNGGDFIIWNTSKFSSTGLWSLGDGNGDGVTDGQDFIIWNTNKFKDAKVDPGAPNLQDSGFQSTLASDLQQQRRGKALPEGTIEMREATLTNRTRSIFGNSNTSTTGDNGFIADTAVDSSLNVRDRVIAEVANEEAQVVRAPALAMRVFASDSTIRENAEQTQAEAAVDSLFEQFAL